MAIEEKSARLWAFVVDEMGLDVREGPSSIKALGVTLVAICAAMPTGYQHRTFDALINAMREDFNAIAEPRPC